MRAICVDDEPLSVAYTAQQCRQLPQIDQADAFSSAQEALDDLRNHPADLALLDIDMPGMDGITLAAKMKKICPDMKILFLTAYREYAFDAYEVHPSGYLLKPVLQEKLAGEVAYALSEHAGPVCESRIKVQTFGGFDVFVDGKKMIFKRSKAKELLAYLINRRGYSVRRATVFAALWEDVPYDRPMQKQMDVIIQSLKQTLQEYGIEHILKGQGGEMWIDANELDCDFYRFIHGEPQAVNEYCGEYMSDYAWASLTEASLDQKQETRVNKQDRSPELCASDYSTPSNLK